MTAVQSVERSLHLLREIAEEPGRLVELADRVNLPTSTTARLLATLESNNAIERNSDGVYRIGVLIKTMGRVAEPGVNLETIAQPHLLDLSSQFDEATCIAVLIGRNTVTTQQVDAPKPVQAEDWTGTRVPLHAGSAGLVIMASWDDHEVDTYLQGNLSTHTEHTVTDPDILLKRINRVRRIGAVWTHSEYVLGLSSCAAAICGPNGRAIGALYTYGPSYRYPLSGEARTVATTVRERARQISASLNQQPEMIKEAS